MKKIYLFLISLFIFSFLVFILGNYFFGGLENKSIEYIENNYIEPNTEYLDSKKTELKNAENDKIKIALKSAYKIQFFYFPSSFQSKIIDYVSPFKTFLNSSTIKSKVDNLKVQLFSEKSDVRGKMKDHSIKLYGINEMNVNEFNAVGIHEFAHFIDLYFLKKEVITDISNYFYNISWDGVKVLKPGLKQTDFVSGYAMTNKYEDFAESFTYYILHNEDFLLKAKKSESLQKKYDFFNKYLFINDEFVLSDFSVNNEIAPYYRDITKINFSLENFLEFLKK